MTLRTVVSNLARRVPANGQAALLRPAVAARKVAPLMAQPRRAFSSEVDEIAHQPTSIFHLTETEAMLQDMVGRFSQDVILPRVRDMDEKENMDQEIIDGLFANGLMGVEIGEEFGGSGMGFGGAIVAIEELAKVDPSVGLKLILLYLLLDGVLFSDLFFLNFLGLGPL